MRNSLEYNCVDTHKFGLALSEAVQKKRGILINAKWHRITFSNAMIISDEQINELVDAVSEQFVKIAKSWTIKAASSIPSRNFF